MSSGPKPSDSATSANTVAWHVLLVNSRKRSFQYSNPLLARSKSGDHGYLPVFFLGHFASAARLACANESSTRSHSFQQAQTRRLVNAL